MLHNKDNTKEGRSEMMTKANTAYRVQKAAKNEEHQESLQRGAAATASHRAGGFAFWKQPCRMQKVDKLVVSEAMAAIAQMEAPAATPASSGENVAQGPVVLAGSGSISDMSFIAHPQPHFATSTHTKHSSPRGWPGFKYLFCHNVRHCLFAMLGFEVRRIQTLVGFMKRFVTHLLGYRLIIGQGRVRFAGPKVEHQNQRIETNVHTPKWAPQMGAQSGLYVWSPFFEGQQCHLSLL